MFKFLLVVHMAFASLILHAVDNIVATEWIEPKYGVKWVLGPKMNAFEAKNYCRARDMARANWKYDWSFDPSNVESQERKILNLRISEISTNQELGLQLPQDGVWISPETVSIDVVSSSTAASPTVNVY